MKRKTANKLAANRPPATALSRTAPLVALGLAVPEVVVPAADGTESEVAADAADEADEEVEVAEEAVDVTLSLVDEEAEVEDASIVNSAGPLYDCSVAPPDVVVVRSSLGMG